MFDHVLYYCGLWVDIPFHTSCVVILSARVDSLNNIDFTLCVSVCFWNFMMELSGYH